ncbi:MAG: hypothetical protein A4E49_00941 [Methanosaeta sp. PtaU1.Bin112]|nr:MAG: hypothetical protein A4E49_00941 [Methanosaeta sp. PtaU1.Bin112]
MNHQDRAFSFQEIESKEDLVAAMFNHKWPLCYSFFHRKLLYLNDSMSEDSPEYAIVIIDKTEGRFGVYGHEVGRINATSMQASEALDLIDEVSAGQYRIKDPVKVVVEPKWHHCCRFCGLEEID